jgi:hypothetical protein
MGKKNIMITSDFLVARPSAVSGVARFFDFAGAFDTYNESRTPDEADANAMYADWTVVGDAIRSAVCHLTTKDEAGKKKVAKKAAKKANQEADKEADKEAA